MRFWARPYPDRRLRPFFMHADYKDYTMKRQKIKYFCEEDKRKLLQTLKDRRSAERDYMIFDLMFATGLRLSELISLNVSHVRDRKMIEIMGKGKKIREIPLNSMIRKHLEQFLRYKKRKKEPLADDSPLFMSRKGNRLMHRAIQRGLDKWVGLSGIQTKYNPHALRHTFGTELYSKCKSIRLV